MSFFLGRSSSKEQASSRLRRSHGVCSVRLNAVKDPRGFPPLFFHLLLSCVIFDPTVRTPEAPDESLGGDVISEAG